MRIKFWGVRGSLGTPLSNAEYRHKVASILEKAIASGLSNVEDIDRFMSDLPGDLSHTYGGDTTCVSVKSQSGGECIIDAGSGIRALGDELMKGPAGKGQAEICLFFTHTHWDHIQGLPFFKPIYIPGNVIHFYSPFVDLDTRLVRQQLEQFFPVPFEGMRATKHFHTLEEGAVVEMPGGLTIDFFPLKHPGGSFSYRFRERGRKFVFATDAEFTGEDLIRPGHQQQFFEGAHVLALDSQYTLDDSFQKFDWGHTSFTMTVNCGVQWKVKNLVLIHHEPSYSDARLLENHRQAIEHRGELKQESPRIFMGREGLAFQIGRY